MPNESFESCTHCAERHISGRCCSGYCNFCGDSSDTERCPDCELLTDDCDCVIRSTVPSAADNEAFLPTICCILQHRNYNDVTDAQANAMLSFSSYGLNADDGHLRVLHQVKFTIQEWCDTRAKYPIECQY